MSDFRNFDQNAYLDQRVRRVKIRRVRKSRIIFSVMAVIGFIAVLVYGSTVVNAVDLQEIMSGEFFKSGDVEKGGTAGVSQAKEKEDDKWVNVLILGADQRDNEPARADIIMIAMINKDQKRAAVLSIPRDTRVPIEGISYKTRINHAHSTGGIELTVKTVEQLLEIPVHKYVETNFKGFENIVDTLGGVPLEVEKRMYYPPEGIDLYKGYQRLNGHDALSYVRYRSDGKGDLPRIERQHKFLKAFLKTALEPKNLIKLPRIVNEVSENVETDMSVRDIAGFLKLFKGADPEDINFFNIPGSPRYINGASYYIVDEEKLHELMDTILENTESGTGKDTII